MILSYIYFFALVLFNLKPVERGKKRADKSSKLGVWNALEEKQRTIN